MGKGLLFAWPVYTVFDEVKPFDGEIEAGFYYIETGYYHFSPNFLWKFPIFPNSLEKFGKIG